MILKLLSVEVGVVGVIVLAITVADIPAITVAITAMSGLIGVLGYWIVTIVNAVKKKQEAILLKQEEIAVKVDGTHSKALEKIDLLQQKVDMLMAAKAEKRQDAAVAAATAPKRSDDV